jgi:WD40 repeat protein
MYDRVRGLALSSRPSWNCQVKIARYCIPEATLTRYQGHTGEIFAARFDPTGQFIASGSMDRSICTRPASFGFGT